MRPRSAQNILVAVSNWPELALQTRYGVAPLAILCGVSVESLRHFIRRRLGKSPKKWLNGLRASESERRLKNGERPKEISNVLGYRDPSHFDHHFVQVHGASPRQWKQYADCFFRTAHSLT